MVIFKMLSGRHIENMERLFTLSCRGKCQYGPEAKMDQKTTNKKGWTLTLDRDH